MHVLVKPMFYNTPVYVRYFTYVKHALLDLHVYHALN